MSVDLKIVASDSEVPAVPGYIRLYGQGGQGKARLPDGSILVLGGLVGTTLNALTLSAATLAEGSAQGTAVGTLQGTTAGSTLSLTDTAGGRFQLAAGAIQAGGTLTDYVVASNHSITVRETLAGASNSPRDTVLTVTVTDVAEGASLNALAFDPGYQQYRNPQIYEGSVAGTVVGYVSRSTLGSVLSLSADGGGLFTLGGLQLRAAGTIPTVETAASYTLTVTEDDGVTTRDTSLVVSVLDTGAAASGAPSLTGYYPRAAQPGDIITLIGANLSTITDIWVGNVQQSAATMGGTALSGSVYQFTMPAGVSGSPVDVYLFNSGDFTHLDASGLPRLSVLTATAPVVLGLSPSVAYAGDTVVAEVQGATGVTEVAIERVEDSTILATGVTVLDATHVQFSVPSASPGGVVRITNPGGVGRYDGALTILPAGYVDDVSDYSRLYASTDVSGYGVTRDGADQVFVCRPINVQPPGYVRTQQAISNFYRTLLGEDLQAADGTVLDRAPFEVMKSQGFNSARIWVHPDAWNQTVRQSGEPGNASLDPDQYDDYRERFQRMVRQAREADLFVIIGIGFNSPSPYQGSGLQPLGSDSSLAALIGLAAVYSDDLGVALDVHNESYPYPFADWTAGQTQAQTWRDGATLTQARVAGDTGQDIGFISLSWSGLGYQTMIDGLRTAGSDHMLIATVPNYGDDFSSILSTLPADSGSNLVLAWHAYPQLLNTWEAASPKPATYADLLALGAAETPAVAADELKGGDTQLASIATVIEGGIPVIATEFGGFSGYTDMAGDEPFVARILALADTDPTFAGRLGVGLWSWVYKTTYTTGYGIPLAGAEGVAAPGTYEVYRPWARGKVGL